jgi:hypothetical protein
MAHGYECLPIEKLQRFAYSKGDRIFSEAAGGNEDAPVRAFCGDNAQELPDALDGNLPIQPVLALDDDSLASASQFEIDPAIRLSSSALRYEVALVAIGLSDKKFEVGLAHLSQRWETSGFRYE